MIIKSIVNAEQLSEVTLNAISSAVIAALKPMITASAVDGKNITVRTYETDEYTKDGEIIEDVTANVTLKAVIEPVEGFEPLYVESVLHIDFYHCVRNPDSNEAEWSGDCFGFNYGHYSHNLTWAIKDGFGNLVHSNGVRYGINNDADNEISSLILDTVFDIDNNDAELQGFLQAIFLLARESADTWVSSYHLVC